MPDIDLVPTGSPGSCARTRLEDQSDRRGDTVPPEIAVNPACLDLEPALNVRIAKKILSRPEAYPAQKVERARRMMAGRIPGGDAPAPAAAPPPPEAEAPVEAAPVEKALVEEPPVEEASAEEAPVGEEAPAETPET